MDDMNYLIKIKIIFWLFIFWCLVNICAYIYLGPILALKWVWITGIPFIVFEIILLFVIQDKY